MGSFAWVMYGVCGVTFAIVALITSTGWYRRRNLRDRANRVGLAVPEDLEYELGRRASIPHVAMAIGGVIATIVAALIAVVFVPPFDDTKAPPPVDPVMVVLVVSGLSGTLLFQVTASVVLTLRRPTGRRVARTTTPQLSDYVSGPERALSLVSPFVAIALPIFIALAVRSGLLQNDLIKKQGALHSTGAFFAYISVGSLVISHVFSRIVLHTRQTARSREELVWDDALRALTLRGLVALPYSWAWQSVLLSSLDMLMFSSWHPGWAVAIVVIGSVGALAGLILLAYRARSSVSDQYFQRRLWDTEALAPR